MHVTTAGPFSMVDCKHIAPMLLNICDELGMILFSWRNTNRNKKPEHKAFPKVFGII